MDSGPQKSKVPILAGEGEGTGENREATVSAASTRCPGPQATVVLLRREGEGLERPVRLEQDDLQSGGGETLEGRQRGEEDPSETEPDEESSVSGDLLVETEGTKGERSGNEGQSCGEGGGQVAAAAVVCRWRALLHPHRKAYIRGRYRSHGITQT